MQLEEQKRAFIAYLSKGGSVPLDEADAIDRDFEHAADLADSGLQRMPGIGFLSTRKRLNAFLAICRHLDDLRPGYTQNVVMLALLIMRSRDRSFLKSMVMFEIRAPRFGLRDIVEMPQTAREYLSTMGYPR